MAIALDLARLGRGKTSPNPAVGAVIIKNGRVLATGFHKKAGMPHAEIEALRRFSGQARNATLYVTLEPCCHHGRTPPCTEAILRSGIREVVVGMRDPDKKVSGQGIRALKRRGVKIREGVLRKECEELNEAYVKHRKTGLPFVILKVAATLNGMVATQKGQKRKAPWITSAESRAQVHELRNEVDAILVGANTIVKDNPRLTTRLQNRKGKSPRRVILDSSLRLSPAFHVFRRSRPPVLLVTVVSKDHPKVRLFRKKGVEILFCKSSDGRVDLKDLLKKLGERDILSLLVEGGPTIHSSFVSKRLADKLILFIAPKLMGGSGLPMFSGLATPGLEGLSLLRKMTVQTVGSDLKIEGYFL